MDYLNFFNLSEDPFGLTPDSHYFYPSKMHNDVLASLDYAVGQKEGFSLVIGEPGTGKTTILKIFIDRWKERAEIALIMTPRLSPEELLQAILDDLNIRIATTNKNEMIKVFRDFLIGHSQAGKRVIIIVDEAQNLSDGCLEELRLLSNLETEKEKLLQIILVGQPELQRRLHSERLRQLDQRISIRSSLRPLTAAETSDYITFRLIRAGKGSAVFDDKAKKAINKLSGGVPRLINLTASRAMMVAYLGASHHIRKRHVLDAAKHIPDSRQKMGLYKASLRYAAILAILIFSAAVLFTGYNMLQQSSNPISALMKAAAPQLREKSISLSSNPTAPVISQNSQSSSNPNPAPTQAALPQPGEKSPSPSSNPAGSVTPQNLRNAQKIATVKVRAARLRERPSVEAGMASVAAKGESFEVAGEWTAPGGIKWYKVRVPTGKECWISSYTVSVASSLRKPH
jgi:type II secretory pathway predicted ATPase ExeA